MLLNSLMQLDQIVTGMKSLTEREEEVMNFFWERRALSVRELLDLHDEPRPSRTTVATFVKFLEQKGYLDHRAESSGFVYFPIIEREEYCGHNLKSVIKRYFDNSIHNVVNFLIKSEEYSDEEAKEMILQISKVEKE